MKGIIKTFEVVGQVIGLLVGEKFTTPAVKVTEQYTDFVII